MSVLRHIYICGGGERGQVVRPNAIARLNGIPSFAWPSDHLALVSQFIIQGREAQEADPAIGVNTEQNAQDSNDRALEASGAESGAGDDPGTTGEGALNVKPEGEQ